MKKTFFTLAIPVFLFACTNQEKKETSSDTIAATADVSATDTAAAVVADPASAAVMAFEQSEYQFATINEGEKVTHEYKFTNSGKTPLIISNATASCGCTVPEYPKAPIAPGQSGIIKVVFDSAGKFGKQSKAITITSNANPPTSTLYLNGEVKQKTN